MHVYVYKVSYCDKDEKKDSKKFCRLETITLIGRILGGRCPGDQLS